MQLNGRKSVLTRWGLECTLCSRGRPSSHTNPGARDNGYLVLQAAGDNPSNGALGGGGSVPTPVLTPPHMRPRYAAPPGIGVSAAGSVHGGRVAQVETDDANGALYAGDNVDRGRGRRTWMREPLPPPAEKAGEVLFQLFDSRLVPTLSGPGNVNRLIGVAGACGFGTLQPGFPWA